MDKVYRPAGDSVNHHARRLAAERAFWYDAFAGRSCGRPLFWPCVIYSMSTPDYRIPSASVAGMGDGAMFWALIENAWPDVAEPDVMQKLRHCTPGQRALLSITLFIREVDNGGLEQFFWNSSGNVGDEVISGFDRLGAPQKAKIVRRAMAFFNSASATPVHATRRQLLAEQSEAEKEAFFEPLNSQLYGETKLWPLFRRYLGEHPNEFFVDSASR